MAPIVRPIEYEEAGPEVRAVYDDIRKSRGITKIPNFWRTLAAHPPLLKRTWESIKEVMRPGKLDARTKELLAIAVSATNGCEYCVRSHVFSARKLGVSDAELGEVMSIVGMFNETNRLVHGFQIEVDDVYLAEPKPAAAKAAE
jgi:AhpD family alkylhydroperoxidase